MLMEEKKLLVHTGSYDRKNIDNNISIFTVFTVVNYYHLHNVLSFVNLHYDITQSLLVHFSLGVCFVQLNNVMFCN